MSKARGLADLGNVYNDGALSNRNLIINGAMQVAQRGTSFAGLTNGNGGYTLDRWEFVEAGSSTAVFTLTQDTDAPDGFASSLKWDCTTADAVLAASEYSSLDYAIEAQDLQHLNYGSAGAVETTISFWVKSNKTGTYVLWFFQPDGTRHRQSQYTIDVADTWEQKTVVIPADTSGVISNDNGSGLLLRFVLGAGTDYTSGTAAAAWEAITTANRHVGQTVNLADTIGNYFQITGVQLEVGDTATPFEHRSYGQELALCQRYYQELNLPSNHYFLCTRLSVSSGIPYGSYTLPVEMRSTPTLSQSGTWVATSGYAGIPVLASPSGKFIRIGGATSVAANATVYATGGDINIDAEL